MGTLKLLPRFVVSGALAIGVFSAVLAWTLSNFIESSLLARDATVKLQRSERIKLEKELLHHLAMEEQEVVPLISRDLAPDEFAAVGAHARASLSPEQLAVGLGLILANTSAARGEAILSGMPVEAREGFEQFGRPVYAAYAERLKDF